MEDIEQQKKEAAKAFGRFGGLATQKKYGNDHFKELSKKGVAARKAKKIAQS